MNLADPPSRSRPDLLFQSNKSSQGQEEVKSDLRVTKCETFNPSDRMILIMSCVQIYFQLKTTSVVWTVHS